MTADDTNDETVDGSVAPESAVSPEPDPDANDQTATRRAALRKAAIGSSVAAAAWVAPRVEGLSLQPDYASAGTARGTFTFSRNANENAAVDFNIPTPTSTEVITATYSHGPGTGNINVSFAAMDPPFNSNCHISGASGSGAGSSNCFAITDTGNIRPTVNSNTSVSWDHYNPWWSSSNLRALDNITFTVIC